MCVSLKRIANLLSNTGIVNVENQRCDYSHLRFWVLLNNALHT